MREWYILHCSFLSYSVPFFRQPKWSTVRQMEGPVWRKLQWRETRHCDSADRSLFCLCEDWFGPQLWGQRQEIHKFLCRAAYLEQKLQQDCVPDEDVGQHALWRAQKDCLWWAALWFAGRNAYKPVDSWGLQTDQNIIIWCLSYIVNIPWWVSW